MCMIQRTYHGYEPRAVRDNSANKLHCATSGIRLISLSELEFHNKVSNIKSGKGGI
jgi:hypothetical protein